MTREDLKNSPVHLIYVTLENKTEALEIARTLVSERWVACANIMDSVTSIYEWQGEVQEGRECVLVAKTTEQNLEGARERIVQLHSYECPCVVTILLSSGAPPFMKWVNEQTR